MLSLCVLALRLDVLRYDAWHDPLTGLYDRRSFDRLLEMAIARSNRYGWPFTLVMLDLDHFKQINDHEGHPAGDASLRELGERFRRALRFGDNAARIGGDEFAMILPNTEPDLVPVLLDRVTSAPGFDARVPELLVRRRAVPARGDAVRRAGPASPTGGSTKRRSVRDADENDGILDDLELELRKLPGVRAAGFDQRDDVLLVQLHVAGEPADSSEPMSATRIAAAPRRPVRSRSRSCAGARCRPRRPRSYRGRPYVDLTLDVPIDAAMEWTSTPARSCRRSRTGAKQTPTARRTGRGCSPCSCSPTPTSSRCTSSTTAGARSAARRRPAGSSARSRPRSRPCAGSVPRSIRAPSGPGRSTATETGASSSPSRSRRTNEVTSMQYGLAAGASAIDAAARSTLDALNRQLARVL